jgi:hypothetical protein
LNNKGRTTALLGAAIAGLLAGARASEATDVHVRVPVCVESTVLGPKATLNAADGCHMVTQAGDPDEPPVAPGLDD